MSTAVATANFPVEPQVKTARVVVPLDALDEPGTYICNWSGHLLRIPEGNLDDSRFAILSDADARPWTLTKISGDPHISQFQAKTLASSFGLNVNF